jgi:hypothetical protein
LEAQTNRTVEREERGRVVNGGNKQEWEKHKKLKRRGRIKWEWMGIFFAYRPFSHICQSKLDAKRKNWIRTRGQDAGC